MSSTVHTQILSCTGPRRRISLMSLFDLARQRRALARMDDARLADLGLSPSEAQTEAGRPIWDVPASWRG